MRTGATAAERSRRRRVSRRLERPAIKRTKGAGHELIGLERQAQHRSDRLIRARLLKKLFFDHEQTVLVPADLDRVARVDAPLFSVDEEFVFVAAGRKFERRGVEAVFVRAR